MNGDSAGAGYRTSIIDLQLGGQDFRICALADRQQYADPDGMAELAGISSAQWSLFGQIWPAGRILAEAMAGFDVAGKRILEIGCGLGLSSLVLQRRRADITASDHHPLAEHFLRGNALRNGLPIVAYRDLPWLIDDAILGRFDLIIGSDVLYEHQHVALLAALLQRHARDGAEIIIADPGRGFGNPLSRALRGQDYRVDEARCAFADTDRKPFRGRLLHYRR
jgi:predicted nicotinamide N-methyase